MQPRPEPGLGPSGRIGCRSEVARGRDRIALGAILVLAAALRLGHWLAVRDEPFIAELVMDSREYDRWAQEIAAGDWLGSGAFFQAPLYPYSLAAVYSLVGRRLDVVYLAQIAFALVGCWALYRAGRLLGGEAIGLAAALLAATYPVFIFYDLQLLKESPAVVLAALLLWALVAARRDGGAWRWLAAGAVCGLLALLRENALLMAPLLLPLALRPSPAEGGLAAAAGRRMGGFAIGLALVLLPVAWRNHRVGGSWLPTTFQGGVNFYIGNHAGADGTYRPLVPGKQVPQQERAEAVRLAEAAAGRQLTAAEVSRYWLGRGLSWAWHEPAAFVGLQLHKLRMFSSWYEWPDAVDYYWIRQRSPVLRLPWFEFGGLEILGLAGLWMIRREPGRWSPVLVFLVASTLATVAFFLFSRYRLPTVPALILLAAPPLAALVASLRQRQVKRATALGLLCLAALALPRLAGYRPRFDLVYYNLARLDQEEGRPAAAASHYREALEHNPQDFLSCLNLGTLAARGGDVPEALRWFQRAVEIQPRSDVAWANLGSAHLAGGDLAAARLALERALDLDPANAAARHNLGLIERDASPFPSPPAPR